MCLYLCPLYLRLRWVGVNSKAILLRRWKGQDVHRHWDPRGVHPCMVRRQRNYRVVCTEIHEKRPLLGLLGVDYGIYINGMFLFSALGWMPFLAVSPHSILGPIEDVGYFMCKPRMGLGRRQLRHTLLTYLTP